MVCVKWLISVVPDGAGVVILQSIVEKEIVLEVHVGWIEFLFIFYVAFNFYEREMLFCFKFNLQVMSIVCIVLADSYTLSNTLE